MEEAIHSPRLVRFGSFEVDLQAGELRKSGLKLKLTGQPFQVLAILLEHPGEVVTREELQKRLWPDTFVDVDHNLNTAINKIREVLGDSAENPCFVETLPRRGYRFIGPLEDMRRLRAPKLGQSPSVLPAEEVGAGDQYHSEKKLRVDSERLSPPARRWFTKLIALGLGILVSVAVLIALDVGRLRERMLGRADTPRIESLAVMPFSTNVREAAGEYLADGVTEGVIDDLSQVPALRVMARGTVFQFKGKGKEPQQVGAALKVDAVVTGDIAQRGDELRVQIQLVRVADGTQIWGQQFIREMKDVSLVQGEIAQDIATRLRLQLRGKEKERIGTPGTRNRLAYQLYLKGRFILAQRRGSGNVQEIESFQQAVALDPSYAQAYASLALTLNIASGYLPPDEARRWPSGRAEAEKAVALNPTLSEAHTALGSVSARDFDWVDAEREFKVAIENNPNDAEAHYFYAISCLLPQKRFDEAISQYRKALDLDPLSVITNGNFAFGLMVAGRFDEAREQFRKTLELDPSFRIALARASEFEAYMGNYASARELLIRAYPEAATLDFGTGKDGYFHGWLKLARERKAATYFPIGYAMLGRKDEAVQALTRNVEDYPGEMGFWIRRPELDSLHSDPRYIELLRHMNLSP